MPRVTTRDTLPAVEPATGRPDQRAGRPGPSRRPGRRLGSALLWTVAISASAIGTGMLLGRAIAQVSGNRMAPWIIARSAGVTSYLLLVCLVLLGIGLSHPWRSRVRRPSAASRIRLHIALSLFTFGFTVLHIVVLATDRYAGVGWWGAFVPMGASYRPLPVTFGILGAVAGTAGRPDRRAVGPVAGPGLVAVAQAGRSQPGRCLGPRGFQRQRHDVAAPAVPGQRGAGAGLRPDPVRGPDHRRPAAGAVMTQQAGFSQATSGHSRSRATGPGGAVFGPGLIEFTGPSGPPRTSLDAPDLAGYDRAGHSATHHRPAQGYEDGRLLAGLIESGLTGRGGGHFPVAAKVQSALRAQPGGTVVGNGSESEPASAKDRALLWLRPQLVLDGLAALAELTEAADAVLWVHEGDPELRRFLLQALDERRRSGRRPGPSPAGRGAGGLSERRVERSGAGAVGRPGTAGVPAGAGVQFRDRRPADARPQRRDAGPGCPDRAASGPRQLSDRCSPCSRPARSGWSSPTASSIGTS